MMKGTHNLYYLSAFDYETCVKWLRRLRMDICAVEVYEHVVDGGVKIWLSIE